MKHYYNDSRISYSINRKLLVELGKTINLKELKNEETRDLQRYNLFKKAKEIEYDYNFYSSIGESSMGGSLTYSQWCSRKEKCPQSHIIKKILLDTIARDYEPRELSLIIWDAICEIQITYLIPLEND
jgi:hypothetical protein